MIVEVKGRQEVALSDVDLVDIIKEHIGDGFAEAIENKLKELDRLKNEEEKMFSEELHDYDMAMTSYENALDNMEDLNKILTEYIENAKRMNRLKIAHMLHQMSDEYNNVR